MPKVGSLDALDLHKPSSPRATTGDPLVGMRKLWTHTGRLKRPLIFKLSPTVSKSLSEPIRHNLSWIPDIAKTSIIALKETSDAFGPLRSVTGAVLAILNVADVSLKVRC